MKIVRPAAITDSVLVSSNVPETDHAAYNAATTYALGDKVIVAAEHRIYESLQSANTGNTPSTSPTWWLDLGATNRWRMFDSRINAVNSQTGSIEVSLQVADRINALSLLNLSATSVQVEMTDAVDGLVYDRTFSTISDSGITDWYAWFFEPIAPITELVVTDLPNYYGATITVTITAASGFASIGELIVGSYRELGDTQYGVQLGIQDYSIKSIDAWGEYSIVERAYRKTASFEIWLPNGGIGEAQRLLAEYRATPVLYIGSDEYSSTAILGFYKDFTINITYPTVSVFSLTVEGLV
jgi:hypothetical protein